MGGGGIIALEHVLRRAVLALGDAIGAFLPRLPARARRVWGVRTVAMAATAAARGYR